jgi:Zn-dependent protease with chaperone function
VNVDLAAEAAHGPIDRSDPWLWAGYLAVIVAVHLIARLVTWASIVVTAWPSRRARGKHWSEQARLTYHARALGARCIFLVVLPLVFAAGRDGRRIELLPAVATICLLFLAAWTGTLGSRIALESRFTPAMALTFRPRRAAWIVNWVLRGVPILAGFALFAIVPYDGGLTAWAILAFGVLAVALYMNLGWLILMRAAGLIRPAGERFRSIVAGISDRMKIGPNATFEIALPMANALAYPAQRAMGITDAALAVLSDEEVSAVAAHEAGHLSEPRWVTAVRFTAGFVVGILVAGPAAVAPLFRSIGVGMGVWSLLLFPVAFLVWGVCFRKVYRRMEERADSLGREFEPAPGAYGRALEKLYATNMMPVVMARPVRRRRHLEQQLYPELYDRMVSAGVTPDFPRPQPPPEWLRPFGILAMIVFVAAGCFAIDRLAMRLVQW